MKRIKKLLTAAIVSVCVISQVGAAERVVPTNPTIKVADLQDSTEVYLFNIVTDDSWMHYNAEASTYMIYPRSATNDPCKFIARITDSGTYRFQMAGSDRSLAFYYGDTWYIECHYNERYYYDFLLKDSANAVVMQLAENYAFYNPSQYIGRSLRNDGFNKVLTGGNIYWLIVPATEEAKKEALRYAAKLRLYNALVASDTYSLNVDSYEELYADEGSTSEELTKAANALRFEIVKSTWPSEEVSMESLTPAPDTIVSGQYYYLYNVDAQMFLGLRASSSSDPTLRNYVTQAIRVTKQSNGYYTMQYSDNKYYIRANGGSAGTDSNLGSRNYFRFKDAGDGLFYIQRDYNYNEAHYLGWTSDNSDYLYDNKTLDTSNNIRWQLIAADEDTYALAQRMMLFKSLETYNAGAEWADYKSMITDGTQTETSLRDAVTQFNFAMANIKTDAPIASWNEVAMTFFSNYEWSKSTSNNVGYYYSWCSSYTNNRGTCSLSARVNIHEASKITFETYSTGTNPKLTLYIDGEVVKTINGTQLYNLYSYYGSEMRENIAQVSSTYSTSNTYRRYIVDIAQGLHTIEWRYDDSTLSGNHFELRNIGIIPASETVAVSYADAGSLGTEILRQVDNVNNVRRLKVTGPMNDDDWGRIAMMTRLVALDLSDAQVTSFPAKKFDNYTAVNWPFLHELKLPKILQSIGAYCFRNSYVEHIDIPESVTTIGEHAFYHSQIHEANIGPNVTSLGGAAFARCNFLEDVSYSPSINYVPTYLFYCNYYMRPFELSSTIETVKARAFDECRLYNSTLPASLKTVEWSGFGSNYELNATLPDSLMTVGERGFAECHKLHGELPPTLSSLGQRGFYRTGLDTINIPSALTSISDYAFQQCDSARAVIVPETTTSIGQYAFSNCDKLEYAELPASYANIANGYIFSGSTAIKTLKIKSPTVLGGTTSTFVNGIDKSQITLQVPDYLVSAYKLNDYWYNFGGFEGFSTEEVEDWVIQYPLTLSQHDRFQGTPNVDVKSVNFIVQGEAGMALNDFNMDSSNGTGGYSSSTQLMSSSNEISIEGELSLDYYTTPKRWFFLSLPFDIRVGDLETTAQYAIAYYDGASRAASGSASGNWKDYTADDIIPAGTGFIYQTNEAVWTRFKALDSNTKNQAFGARDISVALTEHPAESSAHQGWNLVGNPWMTYFNNHSIGFTAPFTIWNPSNSTYTAYSLIDDDYALRPNQAIFVQCPEGASSITFPARGRQLTSVIENQNGVKAQMPQSNNRRIIDLTLTDGEMTDKTRIVLNPNADMGYEMQCDASKFFTIENAPQIYTLDTEGTAYAINERPEESGTVLLAYVAPASGTYTVSMPRCQTARAILRDMQTGESTDLSQSDYTFLSDSGTFANRLELSLKDITTGIDGTDVRSHAAIRTADGGIRADVDVDVYAMDGRLVKSSRGYIRLVSGTYIVRTGVYNVKVVVK